MSIDEGRPIDKQLLILATLMGVELVSKLPLRIRACHFGMHSGEDKRMGRCLCNHVGHEVKVIGTYGADTLQNSDSWDVECQCKRKWLLIAFISELEVRCAISM